MHYQFLAGPIRNNTQTMCIGSLPEQWKLSSHPWASRYQRRRNLSGLVKNSAEPRENNKSDTGELAREFSAPTLVQTRPTASGTPDPLTTQPSVQIPECLPPASIYGKIADMGASKAKLPFWKMVVGGIGAGAFVGFGSALCLVVGGSSPALAAQHPGVHRLLLGAVGLPFGMLMVVTTCPEIFTGNVALMTTAACERRATAGQVLRNWLASYIGNFLGALMLVAIFFASGAMATCQAAVETAVAKSALPFSQAFFRGVLCNWLVCMAVWQANATSSYFGKAIACLLPVTAFIALGLEQCVANMFMVPLGIALGAPVTFRKFLVCNLLPVTLGNIVGGALFVAGLFSVCYGSLGQSD